MGTVMAPATEAVMGALPKAKAGVGSAVNDTTRQIGGALGVAVLGSILSSVYRSQLGDTIAGHPVPKAAQDGVAGALAVAAHLPDPVRATLAASARTAFIHGMDSTVLVATGVAAAGALLALIWLPARARQDTAGAAPVVHQPQPESRPAPVPDLAVAG
jgi:DHA2 family multidrug resistance protein-like MFS transporter